MEKVLRDKMVAAARENGKTHGKVAELDFGAGAEWMYEQLRASDKVVAADSASTNDTNDAIALMNEYKVISMLMDTNEVLYRERRDKWLERVRLYNEQQHHWSYIIGNSVLLKFICRGEKGLS